MKNQMQTAIPPTYIFKVVRAEKNRPSLQVVSKQLCFVNRFHGKAFFTVHELAHDASKWDEQWFTNYE
jgi:hypothetical protein